MVLIDYTSYNASQPFIEGLSSNKTELEKQQVYQLLQIPDLTSDEKQFMNRIGNAHGLSKKQRIRLAELVDKYLDA